MDSPVRIDRERIHGLLEEQETLLNNIVPLVVICGPAKCEDGNCDSCDPERKNQCTHNHRYVIKDRLNEENCLAITFEEDFELEVASVQEQILLRNEEVDIVFIIPDSEGSAAELALFARDPIIKTKLRVLVPHEFHPLYTEETSFLTSYYLELMSDLGHIYPYDPDDETHPSSQKIASKMMQSYRLRKLATSLGN